ncbi:MAG: hypothetical protein QW279_06010 [Candidatus Jordarchaeaceae archaeon]
MPETVENSSSGNNGSKENEVIEFDEDSSPKRGLTFIFAAAGFSVLLLAALASLSPYLVPKILGVEYYQNLLYGFYIIFPFTYGIATNLINGYSHIFYLTYVIVSTCVTALAASLLYFSWSGEKKLFPDSLIIGLFVSFFSLFFQYGVSNLFLQYQSIIIKYYVSIQNIILVTGYTFDWLGILILLASGTLSGALGFRLSK